MNRQNTYNYTLFERPALYTDYYELTMAQGYFLSGRQDEKACFDYFFRDLPFDGGYVVFAGLTDLLKILNGYQFYQDELSYLSEQGFEQEFLEFLDDFQLDINIHAAKEGEIVFPHEPALRVEGTIIETQILETLLLNILNFESLIATKAFRMKYAAGGKKVIDFGLRRAQGFGGIQASKGAAIGGIEATSNVYSSFTQGLTPSGTMAHSWIQSFEDELTAFRKYAEYYPDNCTLLVDTYDTLNSGVPNAIKVGKELEEQGHKMKAIRLDSGDLAYYSRKARKQLDDAGLDYVKIAVSNQLDEHLIKSLLNQDAPIDLFGVGTRLVTGYDTPALDGVYKLAAVNNQPKLKISENVEKSTLPGRKKVFRYHSSNGAFLGDGIVLADEEDPAVIHHPHYPAKHTEVTNIHSEPLLHPIMKNGEQLNDLTSTSQSAAYARQRFDRLKPEHKRFNNPHIYKVGVSKKLMNLRDKISQKLN